MNIYTFFVIFNKWNDFDVLMLVFGCVHLIVPAYATALAYYFDGLVQTIIYYLGSTVKTLATTLLFLEAAFALMGLFQANLSENPSMQTMGYNLL